VQALTRGDGEVGEDITRNVLLMAGAVKMLPPTLPDGKPTPSTVFVRGEIVCLKSDFRLHFQGESNPRNTASGTSKRQTNHEKCQYLTIITYECLPVGVTLASKSDEINTLRAWGFRTPNCKRVLGFSEIEDVYQGYVQTHRAALDYDIDGLVVYIDDTHRRDALGELNNRPRGACAYKFPHEQKSTVLRNIRWQVGNSGRITPVAEFDSVLLAGANVVQASLHNISNIRDLWGSATPCSGDLILASRRNDVIPFVESVITAQGSGVPFPVPTECPICKTPLQMDGEYLVCRGEDCSGQVTGSIKRWVKKLGVLHVGDTLIEAMVEEFPFILVESEFEERFGVTYDGFTKLPPDEQDKIRNSALAKMDMADLYLIDPDRLADRQMGGRRIGSTADKAINNLRAKMTLPIHVLVGSLGINLIGRDMAKTIVDGGFESLSKMLKARIPEIAAIPGMGDTKARAFVDGFAQKAGLVGKLLAVGIQVQIVSGNLAGKSFCFTGFRSSELEDAIVKAGGTMKSGVSKGLHYLVSSDPTSNTGKMQKARSLGTLVISEDEARTLAGI
jgi:DNA ligase (NAD+)